MTADRQPDRTPENPTPGIPARALPDVDFGALPGVEFSALAYDVDTGTTLFSHAPERVLSTASIAKIFLLHATLRMVERGELSLDERLRRRPSERVDESGLWYLLQQDSLSVFDIGMLIGAFSDNFGTNVLLRRVGLDRVAASAAELGYTDSALHDFLRWPRPAGAPSRLSSGTAAEIADFMARLARDELFDAAHSEVLRRWLGAGADTSMVASAFEPDPLAHYYYTRGSWVWNKTGTDSTVRCDAGVAMTRESRVAYAVFANWESDTDRVLEVMPLMRRAGEIIGAYLQPEIYGRAADAASGPEDPHRTPTED
ncbi:class A beta-lactamase-related serine hydrolase [Nocardia zapadnayensis]|uniref:Serine hydrolase n=1 Tax=Brevibacterium pityocampae TaxID=506594 RepID=A0ABP8JR99_9MICO|nr:MULTISPECIES: serine hydrolase [Actinomycetes]MCK1801469.1 class A beta-lactamase-related serine hydrolase [Brevibacterium sp. R8603A2]MCX0277688.1 class A beta-lactamase-related serine hydrolase [Nocardia zapadnayensis]